ncbi:fumarylacetoacetate hydrolase family protein [Amycolatopsis jiangsuensis]|uniref:2-keto-4-pentenoate hydratase/2-oxohepta-3-ene-1,7-dioic acid hydratase in catechol pathway n=1 Tax=Amycolatopsis jiangsuensis TaxID=1181879 RepID=A0A840IPP0_9PSEU|nr:fumarylacetoacetate hydrolase family protein [Amycolatopsis jiangsuensis]MBB4683152.1 2-keto-4-pentenoate hydratase/2-oxohepta-3-ene-1,7-dioic acid hydratase in catechol pathway [Amycolatopsis jiangsuensis]
MRIVRHRTDQGPRLAVLDDEDVLIDLPAGLDLPTLLADDGRLAATAHTARRTASRGVPLNEAELMTPLDPPTVRDFSTFPEHTAGIARNLDPNAGVPEEFWQIPAFYFSNPYATIGPHDDVPVPPGCERFDFELEVAAVVGRAGGDLTVEQAAEHIAGFVVFNDFSARDIQFHEMRLRLGPAKGKDTATSLGTVFVTADELRHRASGTSYDLTMRVLVNDEEIGTDRLDNMAWSFPSLAAYASRGTEIRPGDLLGSGTCRNGCLAELWGRHGPGFHPSLQPGDVVTTEVELLGGTRNRIVTGAAPHPIRPGVSS